MDIGSFFGTSKWKILELIAEKPSSPTEIALMLKTSVSYVSQQLKLLEAAGFIVREKTGIIDKEKPRYLYSLANEIFHLAALAKGWSSKKLFHLTDYHKIILKIWLLENSLIHYHVEKLFWLIEYKIDEIEGIFFRNKDKNELIFVSESKLVKNKIDSFLKQNKDKITVHFVNRDLFFKKFDHGLFSIYDPGNLAGKLLKTERRYD